MTNTTGATLPVTSLSNWLNRQITILSTIAAGALFIAMGFVLLCSLHQIKSQVHVVVISAVIVLTLLTGLVIYCRYLRAATQKRVVEPLITLSDREARYRLITDHSADVIWVIDLETRLFTYVSPSVVRLRGYTPEEVVGKRMDSTLTPDSLKVAETALATMVPAYFKDPKAPSTVTLELSQPCKDGSVVQVEIIATLIKNKLGKFEIVGVSRNITDRKKVQKDLRESMELLSLFIKQSPIYTYIKTVQAGESRVIHASENFGDITGIPGSKMAGKTMQELFPADFAMKITNDDWAVISQGKTLQVEEHFNGKDYITIKFPILQEERHLLAGYTIDITERKQLEETLNKTQKLEALGILAGGIAHDFNNLLGGIYGFIDLATEAGADQRIRHYLSKATSTIDRGRDLTRQLITFAKGGTPVKKVAPLFPFIHETAQFALSGSNVSLRVEAQPELWVCNYDQNQIGQAIDNIIINAKQAMPDGGTIELTAKKVVLGENGHAVLPVGCYVQISIKDYGIGMPKEILPRIFDPFYTTKTTGQGLGLATCYSIIKRHGGAIDVESTPGKGSTFNVLLPALVDNVATKVEEISIDFAGSGLFVVMDDEEIMRDVLGDMLECLGYDAICTANSAETIEIFTSAAKDGREIVGAFLDLTIPGSAGGKETIVELRKINTKTAVFAVSGHAEDPVIATPEVYGFTGSICKPFRRTELTEFLNRYMQA